MQAKQAIRREDSEIPVVSESSNQRKNSQKIGSIEPSKKAISLQELAEILSMNYFTLYRWMCKGRIKCIRLGRVYRVPMPEVERLLKEGCQGVSREDLSEE